jgi:hypothetical protein
LFSLSNIAMVVTGVTSAPVYTLANGSNLAINTTYYVGVRAVDASNNRETNLVSLNAISTGVIAGIPTYSPQGAFVVNSDDNLQGTIWITKNDILMTSGLGTASYEVYDKDGNLVPGVSETGISPDANGQFIITPSASPLQNYLDHYVIKLTVNADSANRIAYIPLIQKTVTYKTHGVFSINASNQFIGTLWASFDDQAVTQHLGTASYTVYNASGTAVAGMTQSGITADVNGRYIITPVASSLVDLTHYTIQISIEVDGEVRTSYRGITLGI